MTLRSFLDRLLRPRSAGPFAFEAEWADLLAELGLPPTALRDVAAADSLHPHFHYRHFTRPKRGGGLREIAAPDAKLKRVQQAIIARYLRDPRPHPAAVAYRRGKSTADHAWAHAGAEVVVTADVRDFFPATAAWRVEAWWRGRVDDDSARLLTRLTTDRGGLPQGAPTSPGLSNLVNHDLDVRVERLADAAGARYTRFCDDLAFSWRCGGPPTGFEAGVRSALGEFGYELHPGKGWRVWVWPDEPVVVGVVLGRDGKVRLPAGVRREMGELARSGDPPDAARLMGYRGYEAMMTRRPGRRRKTGTRPAAPLGHRRGPSPMIPRSDGPNYEPEE